MIISRTLASRRFGVFAFSMLLSLVQAIKRHIASEDTFKYDEFMKPIIITTFFSENVDYTEFIFSS